MPACRASSIAAAAVVLGGCGGGAAVHARGGVVDVRQSEYRVSPQTVVVSPGRVTFVVRDTGRLAHNLRLRRGGRTVKVVSTIRPGQVGRGTVTVRRGTYRIYCSVGRHEVLGEYGALVVR